MNSILEDPEVQAAAKWVVIGALVVVGLFLREVAARLAAKLGAIHAEGVARETGARRAEKMDLAKTHAAGLLPPIIRPRASRSERLIEGTLESVRKSMPPGNSGPSN